MQNAPVARQMQRAKGRQHGAFLRGPFQNRHPSGVAGGNHGMVDQRHFAVSTQSCRVQEFKEAPPDPGMKLGAFREKDGEFTFVAERG